MHLYLVPFPVLNVHCSKISVFLLLICPNRRIHCDFMQFTIFSLIIPRTSLFISHLLFIFIGCFGPHIRLIIFVSKIRSFSTSCFSKSHGFAYITKGRVVALYIRNLVFLRKLFPACTFKILRFQICNELSYKLSYIIYLFFSCDEY